MMKFLHTTFCIFVSLFYKTTGFDFSTFGIRGTKCTQSVVDRALTLWVSKFNEEIDLAAAVNVINGVVVPLCKHGLRLQDESESHGNCFNIEQHGDVIRLSDLYKIIAGISCTSEPFDFSQFGNKAVRCTESIAATALRLWKSKFGQYVDPRAKVTVVDGLIQPSCTDGFELEENLSHVGNCINHATHGSVVRRADLYRIVDGIRCTEINQNASFFDESESDTEADLNIPEFQRNLLNGHNCSQQPIQPVFQSARFRIVGGKTAAAHSWPWQVRLLVTKNASKPAVCGGTLISDQYVLSAVHCIANPRQGYNVTLNPSQVWIAPGFHRDPSMHEISEENGFIQVADLRANPTFPTQAPNNDVAVFKLSKPIVFDQNIQPSCIATKEIAAGNQCVATGWGGTNYATMPQSEYLQQIKGTVLQDPYCNGTMAGAFDYNGTTMVCMEFIRGANQTAAGTAGGDSGGPINCKRGDRYYSAGSLSGGGPGSAMYTEFADHLEFIEKSINDMQSSTNKI